MPLVYAVAAGWSSLRRTRLSANFAARLWTSVRVPLQLWLTASLPPGQARPT